MKLVNSTKVCESTTNLQGTNVAAYVLSVPIGVSVKQKLDNGVLVVQFAESTRNYRFLQTALGKGAETPARTGLICLVESFGLWLASHQISAVCYRTAIVP
jgi:hypothetical protein